MSNGNGHRWSKFWWRDWDRDLGLRMCSLAAQGLWMRMLCIAHEANPTGYVTVNGRPPSDRDYAAWTNASPREIKKLLAELEENNVFSRGDNGVIYCRRMVRDAAAEANAKEAWEAHGKRGGNPQIIRGTVDKSERQRPYRRSDSPQKTERIFQRDGGRCHWCQVPLLRDNPQHPHFFHVDHIVAVRDGGGVEEANLVAACQRCNMKRARHETEPMVAEERPYRGQYIQPGTSSDSNRAEIPTARVGSFRQQPPESDVESESEPEREERKGLINKNSFLQGTRARPERLDDALEAVLSEAGVASPGESPVDPARVVALVRGTKRALEMRIPYGEVRSVEAQIDALTAQPPAVGSEASMGLVWQPHEPIRTPAQQYAELTGCSLAEAEARFADIAA